MNDPNEKFVVAHHASSPAEAEVVKGVLVEAGIEAFIANANTPFPGLDLTPASAAMEGCEVMVPTSDSVRAQEVLRAAHESGQQAEEE